MTESNKAGRILSAVCAAFCILSILTVCAAALYTHPHFDDYTFAVSAHDAWEKEHTPGAVLKAALESSRHTRATWQGTYTGTFLSNLQPSIFTGKCFWNVMVILGGLVFCVWYFWHVLGSAMGMSRAGIVTVTSIILTLMIQMMPDIAEAFFWFNGGIGNTFIIALLFLSFALSIRLMLCKSRVKCVLWFALLLIMMVLLGGGSYGGGLFGLCLYALWTGSLFIQKKKKSWAFLALWLVFLGCFVYSMAAPGNYIRSQWIDYREGSPQLALFQCLYYGTGLIGNYTNLTVLASTVLVLPFFRRAAVNSGLKFRHPWVTAFLLAGVFCSQLTPTMYSGVFFGGTRTVDAFYECFLMLWFVCVFYLTGAFERVRREHGIRFPALGGRNRVIAILTTVVLLCAGCLSFRHNDQELYGIQNLTTPQIAMSFVKGEIQAYDREMKQRQDLLENPPGDEVELVSLTVSPSFFMPDLLAKGSLPEETDNLCNMLQRYYGIEHVTVRQD